MKLCGRPPSKPSIQSTCIESADWLVIEQFCNGNGRPDVCSREKRERKKTHTQNKTYKNLLKFYVVNGFSFGLK